MSFVRVFARIIDSSGKKRVFPVKETDTIIGRSKKAHIVLKDDICSGLHAKIFIDGDGVYVEDLKSKNGLFLNEIKVLKQRIYIGDEVKLGNSFLKLDDTKMSNEDIESLTHDSPNRQNGSITLEVETFHEMKSKTHSTRKQKDFMKDSKLYAGVEKDAKREKFSAKKLVILDRIAFFIDLFLNIGLLLAPFIYLQQTDKRGFNEILKDPTNIIVGQNLFYLIGGVVIAFMFLKWNRGSGRSSIGEKICGL
jgi:pSer/pThr/pTyr-binding forkhead associated (FHA) protein